jgi:TatD DNase family protein
MLLDTHAHLNFTAFKKDADEVIKRCRDNKIWTINVGTKYETSKKAVELAQKYKEGVFAAVGLHPIHLETGLVKIKNDTEEIEIKTTEQDFDYEKYKALAENQKVVAIGEIGLDYYWKPKGKVKFQLFKEKQKAIFIQQLELTKELNLPVILHCRMAHEDMIHILQNYQHTKKNTPDELLIRGVVHCFTGSWEQAEKFLAMGFYLGFNGIIFKKIEGVDFKKVIENTPLDRILLETDCPYLTPPPMEGRNEPLYLKYIAEEVAKIKNLSYEKVVNATTGNARNLFKI